MSPSAPNTRGAPLALLLLLASCPRPAATPQPGADPGETVALTVIATNDLHGQLEPLELETAERPPRRYRVGGAEALAATIAELRASAPGPTVLLDAGDFMQGSLVSNSFEGAPMRELFELLGYDAVTIGNHEFDFGPKGDGPGDPNGAIRDWIARARLAVLAANIEDRASGRPVAWSGLRPAVVLNRGGIRVGIIGVATPGTAVTTMPEHVVGLRFTPMLEAVRRHARRLRASGVQVVIVLAHSGGSCTRRDVSSCSGEIFTDLLDGLRPGEVDAVVGGHTHRCIWHRHRGAAVVEACGRGIAVARVTLLVDRKAGAVVGARVAPPVLTCHDTFSDTGGCEGGLRRGPRRGTIVPAPLLARRADVARAARRIVERYTARLGPVGSRVLARLARPLRHDGARASALGTLFARALLAAVPDADFAIVNSGSLRADLPVGPVTLSRLHAVFPFDNRVATAQLTGAEVQRLVATLLRNGHGLLQVAGLRLRIRCKEGDRTLLAVEDARDGTALVQDRRYSVALSDFLLTGGDGLGVVLDDIPSTRKRIDARLIRDEVVRYLGTMEQPINSTDRPVMARPPIAVEGDSCVQARPGPRHLCR